MTAPGAAHSGAKCWGTNLTGDVPLNSDSYLTSPAITVPVLSAGQVARVRFWAWIAVDEMYDRGEFQVSSNGLTWVTKAQLFHTMLGSWTEYYFDVSEYANGPLYLRFRCRADEANAFAQSPYNMAGLYIDDVAVIVSDAAAVKTTLTLTGYENQDPYASCPWLFSWDGQQYVKDNDIYSTARGSQGEYTDYFKLGSPLVAQDGLYRLELKETDSESSHTDLVKLITVDHAAGVKVGSDDAGNIWTYQQPKSPTSAVADDGSDVAGLLASEDGVGASVYDGSSLTLDFGDFDPGTSATLVLRALGFQADGDAGKPTYKQPRISIQTQGSDGQWVTRNVFYPRMNWATGAYNLAGYLGTSKLVRLSVASCNERKYHIIDYVGLDTTPQAPRTVNVLSPASAVHSVNGNVAGLLQDADAQYATMATSEQILLSFAAPALTADVREFVFEAKGYYEPNGTLFIYTWDGSNWAQRDGWSAVGDGDQTRAFDLSLWLPDAAGEYKVRIWQDFWYDPAGIDYVALARGSTTGTMSSATDLRKSQDVKSLLQSADGNHDDWPYDNDGYNNRTRSRNRWVEVKWSGLTSNTPPTTNPVTISDPANPDPTIGWVYNDAENDPQVQYDLQVWTGPGGTGQNVWNPPVGSGTSTSVVYGGVALVSGSVYYARVRAFDGVSWGPWAETSWTFTQPAVTPTQTPTSTAAASPTPTPTSTASLTATSTATTTPTSTLAPSSTPTPTATATQTAAATPTATLTSAATPTSTETPTVTPTTTPPPAPQLGVQPPEAHDFGSVLVGYHVAFSYTVTNTGGGTLTGTVTAPCDGFSVAPPDFSLGAGQQTSVVVTFTPGTPGPLSCQLNITSNGGRIQLALSGGGVPLPPIPVVPSPTSPAGLAMISVLALSIGWMLQARLGDSTTNPTGQRSSSGGGLK